MRPLIPIEIGRKPEHNVSAAAKANKYNHNLYTGVSRMPSGKSRKIAARQAQLSGRSKRNRPRGVGGSSLIKSSEGSSNRQSSTPEEYPVNEATSVNEASQIVPEHSQRPSSTRPNRRLSRHAQPLPIETYFGREMRRIATVVVLVSGILTALAFVL